MSKAKRLARTRQLQADRRFKPGPVVVVPWDALEPGKTFTFEGGKSYVFEAPPTTTIFVNEDGDDELGDGSAERPFRTVQHALTAAKSKTLLANAPI